MTKLLALLFLPTFVIQILSSFYYSNQMVELNQQLQEQKVISDTLLFQKQQLENRWADLNRLQDINSFADKNHLIPVTQFFDANQ